MPTLINGTYHIFFVKNRDLVESELFNKKKGEVTQILLCKNQLKLKMSGSKKKEPDTL